MNKFIYVVRRNFTVVRFNYDSPNARGGWAFNHMFRPTERPVTALISGLELRTRVSENWLYSYTIGNVQENVKIQLDYLKQLVRFPVPDVQIQMDDLPEWKQPLLFSFNECQILSMLGKKESNEKMLHEILQTCSVTDSIYMRVPMSSTFTNDLFQWKLPKKIYIKQSAHWITAETLFRLKCSHMTFIECKLTAQDFLQFVERWLNSDDTNFEYLNLEWKNGVPRDLKLDDLGVELSEFDSKRRHESIPYIKGFAMNVSAGQDFYRKDGVLATILITRWSAIFCVFYERFPNLDGRQIVRPPLSTR
ncbi:unnamed protein product [Caenorhabditis brenneri]